MPTDQALLLFDTRLVMTSPAREYVMFLTRLPWIVRARERGPLSPKNRERYRHGELPPETERTFLRALFRRVSAAFSAGNPPAELSPSAIDQWGSSLEFVDDAVDRRVEEGFCPRHALERILPLLVISLASTAAACRVNANLPAFQGVVRVWVEEQIRARPLAYLIRVDKPMVEVAETLGVSRSTLCRWRSGATRPNSAKQIDAIVEHVKHRVGDDVAARLAVTFVLALANGLQAIEQYFTKRYVDDLVRLADRVQRSAHAVLLRQPAWAKQFADAVRGEPSGCPMHEAFLCALEERVTARWRPAVRSLVHDPGRCLAGVCSL